MTDFIDDAIKTAAQQLSEESDLRYAGMKTDIHQAVEYFQVAMFPSFYGQNTTVCSKCPDNQSCVKVNDMAKRTQALQKAAQHMISALSCVVSYQQACELTKELVLEIPNIKEVLKTDVRSAFEGDPAATSEEEIILSYPAFPAICIYRLAHKLYTLKAPVVPRMMTEYAHQLTGIDIHPGATIGSHFFIDHGTGVVIGETSTIGDHVKLYQHVTLGAKSFEVQADGSLVKGIKRHPNVGNNVIIYAGATILGGDVSIGDNCVIGGNVWLTHSVRPNQTVVR